MTRWVHTNPTPQEQGALQSLARATEACNEGWITFRAYGLYQYLAGTGKTTWTLDDLPTIFPEGESELLEAMRELERMRWIEEAA